MQRPCPIQLYCAETDVWVDEPTPNGIVVYSIITPILALFGIIGNLFCFIIFMSIKTCGTASTTTYLTVLALTDLVASAFLLISGLCRGILWSQPGWREYEAIITIPFGGTFTCWAATAVVGVTIDRMIFIWCPERAKRPAASQQKQARFIMLGGLLTSILFNLPYCFMYSWDANGKLTKTKFVNSTYYFIHNWVKLVLFCLIPAFLLILGNIGLIRHLKKMFKISDKCRQRCNKAPKTKEQRRVTITLVLMIFLFLMGEIPANLVSRSSVVALLFWGDNAKADHSKALEFCRQVATVLNGVYLAANFFVYYMFCHPFRQTVWEIITCKFWRRNRNRDQLLKCNKNLKLTQVNIFIVNEKMKKYHDDYWVSFDAFHKKFRQVINENNKLTSVITTVRVY